MTPAPRRGPGRKPSLRVERALQRDGHRVLAGMDEVGRGALAGPVTVGVVVIDETCRSAPTGVPKASASECAASVESTRVRSPRRAARVAVPAAVVVLPTPPLPVNNRMRTAHAPRAGAVTARTRRAS